MLKPVGKTTGTGSVFRARNRSPCIAPGASVIIGAGALTVETRRGGYTGPVVWRNKSCILKHDLVIFLFAPTPPFLFAKNRFLAEKGAVNASRDCHSLGFPTPSLHASKRGSSCTAGAMSTMGVHMGEQNAASVLGIKSYVGPLGDMTVEARVDQAFNHELLDPALKELKDGLSVGRFEGQHVALAQKLLDRIKTLRRARRERDRVRRVSAEKIQVCLQQSHATVPRQSLDSQYFDTHSSAGLLRRGGSDHQHVAQHSCPMRVRTALHNNLM